MKKYTVKIEQDLDPESPRECDNLGTMACAHGGYNLGDEQMDGEQLAQHIKENGGVRQFIMLPLYLYDHSGLTMNTTGFQCPWDSGMVGYIYVSREKVREEFSVKRITKKSEDEALRVLRNEVSTYNQYLEGNVFGYIIEDEDGEQVDSCWGFYGFDYCKEEAQSIVNWYKGKDAKNRANKLKTLIKEHVPLAMRPDILAEV